MRNQYKFLVLVAPFVFVVLWSTGFVVARLTAGHVEPVSFLAFRFPLAGALLGLLALLLRSPWPSRRDGLQAALVGAFLHAGYLAPIYWAVAHGLPGGVSALIVGLQPLITALLAGYFLREKVGLQHWLGLAIGICGVAMVLAPKFNWASVNGISPVTALLCLFGTLSVAVGTIYQKRFASHLPLLTSVVWQYAGASIVVVLLAAATENFVFDGSLQAWGGLLWSILVISFAAIFMLMLLIRQGAVAKVSSLIFLVPGTSAFMTYWLFNERLTPLQILGMLVCAAAVFIVNRGGPGLSAVARRFQRP